MKTIVRVWLLRFVAIQTYLARRPEKLETIELETLRAVAINLVKDIDKILNEEKENEPNTSPNA